MVIKRRNIYGERAADLINFYFRMANLPIRYVSEVDHWRRWEANCFQMLNGDRFHAKIMDARTVRLDKLPGQSLWDRMGQGTLNERMLEAAGREYYRAHQFRRREFGSPWSHGDASMTASYDGAVPADVGGGRRLREWIVEDSVFPADAG